MNIPTIEKWTWILVYGGLVLLCFGLAVRGRDDTAGHVMIGVGAVVAAAGFALIYVRSRMKNKDD